MIDLFAVFEHAEDQVGISLFGTTRALIHVSDGALVSSERIELDRLSSVVAELKRKGFHLAIGEGYFDDKANIFRGKHSDFIGKSYFAFVFARNDIHKDVAEIENLARVLISSHVSEKFQEWLRSLDLCSGIYVATKTDPVFVLVLCEFARKNGLDIHAAYQGIPSTRPSEDQSAWKKWLMIHFREEDALAAFDSLNWNKPIITNPVQQISIESDIDMLSFSF